jgi:uncharacterized protein YfaT (DUF1175 family)
MTIRRVRALNRHWKQHPRVEWLVAGFVGYEAPKRQAMPVHNGNWVANDDLPDDVFSPEFMAEIERLKAEGPFPKGKVVGGF